MVDIASIVGVCVIAAIICRLFENGSREYGLAVTVVVCSVVLLSIVTATAPLLEELEALLAEAGADSTYFQILTKALAVCIISQLGADICRDCRESAIASVVELAGRVALLLLTMPLLREAAALIRELLQ